MTKHLGFCAVLFLLVLTFGTLCQVRIRELGLQRELQAAQFRVKDVSGYADALLRKVEKRDAKIAEFQAEELECNWPVKIPAKLNGQSIDICVYPEPLRDGGFVINVHDEQDKLNPDGVCWGTVIYPGKEVEQEPLTDDIMRQTREMANPEPPSEPNTAEAYHGRDAISPQLAVAVELQARLAAMTAQHPADQTTLRLAAVQAEYDELISQLNVVDGQISEKSKELSVLIKERKRLYDHAPTLRKAIELLTVEPAE